MDSNIETRRKHADRLRAMWSTHTHQCEPIREAFFREVDLAVVFGKMSPVSMIGDMLCVGLPSGSIYVLFPTTTLRHEFVEVVEELLADNPDHRRIQI